MKRISIIRTLSIVVLPLFLFVFPFQNCGRQFILKNQEPLSVDLASKACDADLQDIFKNEFHPFLKTNCSLCHVEGGPGIGHFAQPDWIKAWAQFESIGTNAIIRNATNNNHKPPYTGNRHASFLQTLKLKWEQAYHEKTQCEISQNGFDPLKTPFKSQSIIIPELSNSDWVTLTWDLYNQAENLAQNNLVNAQFRIEIRNFIVDNKILGYEFRNPQVRIMGNSGIQFKDLFFWINNTKKSDLSYYSQINKVVYQSNDWVNLMENNSSAFLVTDQNPESVIALEFDKVTIDIEVINYSDLVGNDVKYNVFQTSCIGCHNSGSALGGLDLTSYNQSRLRADTIISRMKNSSRPMPPSGVLDANRIRLVEQWVEAGTPQ